MSTKKLNSETNTLSGQGGVIERMDLECDETLTYLKEIMVDSYDLNNEREEEIFMNGFIEAMEYFRTMLESVR